MLNVSEKNIKEKKKEAANNTFTAYEIGEYYYLLANYEKAVEWYEKAALGSPAVPMALYAMGYACQNGEGTAVDLFRAAQFYEAAAEKDIPQACYNLAFFYQNGIGVCRDLKKANRYCEKASESLKRLADASKEAKEDLYRIKLSHTQLVNSVLENENKWMTISNESAQKSQKIGELEASIADYNRTVLELKGIIKSKEKELTFEQERDKKMKALHGEALRQIDKLNDDIRSLKCQVDELNARHVADTSQNDFLNGRNKQLETDNNHYLQSQDKYNKELLAAQKQIDDLNNKVSTLTASGERLIGEIVVHQGKEKKTKKQRNAALIFSIAVTSIAFLYCYLYYWG